MKSYGEPGGIYFRYELDMERGEYVVTNEDGDEVYSNPAEVLAQQYCEEAIEREQRAASMTDDYTVTIIVRLPEGGVYSDEDFRDAAHIALDNEREPIVVEWRGTSEHRS
jgi:hypothetical protein